MKKDVKMEDQILLLSGMQSVFPVLFKFSHAFHACLYLFIHALIAVIMLHYSSHRHHRQALSRGRKEGIFPPLTAVFPSLQNGSNSNAQVCLSNTIHKNYSIFHKITIMTTAQSSKLPNKSTFFFCFHIDSVS